MQQYVGKRNMSLELANPQALDLLLRLAHQCDVFNENFRPGVATRMGLGYEAVSARNPRIVYASISGYGQTGPWVGRRAYAPVVGAESGVTQMQGDAREGDYANDPLSHADVYTAIETASAILAVLYQREHTGRGDWIDVSMTHTMLYVNEHVHDELWDGPIDPQWIRSFQPAEYPVLTAANGRQVVIAGHPAERGTFEKFMRGIDRPDLITDPRFPDPATRLANIHDLMGELQGWAATVPTPGDIEHALSHQGLATGALRSVREVCDTDWAAEREVTVDVPDRGGGVIRIPNAPWRFAGSDVRTEGEPRYRGEDNHAVLSELLGLPTDELDRLDRTGVLSSRVPTT